MLLFWRFGWRIFIPCPSCAKTPRLSGTRLGCVINMDTTLKSGKKPYTAMLGSDAKKWGRDGQARRRLFCGDEAVAHITI
jgi:hypothetical protein